MDIRLTSFFAQPWRSVVGSTAVVMVFVQPLTFAISCLFYLIFIVLCQGNSNPLLKNDVTACLSCTVTPLGSSELHSGPTRVKFGEDIPVDPLLLLSSGYSVICAVGVPGAQDSETSVIEGIIAMSANEPTAPVFYISHFLKSVTRVLSNQLNTDQLLGALHSKDL